MTRCVLCGEPMAFVAPGLLMHLSELPALLPDGRRSTFVRI
jgi:hypothetical protein